MNSYSKINYVNGSDPPLNAENLNHMDDGIEAVTEAVTAIETEVAAANEGLLSKADKSTTLEGYGITDAITNTNDSVKTQNIANGAVTEDKLSADTKNKLGEVGDAVFEIVNEISVQTNTGYKLSTTSASGVVGDAEHQLFLFRYDAAKELYVKTDYGYAFRSGTSGSTTIETHLGKFDTLLNNIPDGTKYIVVDTLISDPIGTLYTKENKVQSNSERITDLEEQMSTFEKANERIVVTPQIEIPCNEFFNTTSSGNYLIRDFAVKGRYLYLVNKWTVYKIDISCSDDPVITASVELTDVKTSYVITIDSKRTQYPATVSGVFVYDDKLIIAMRMKISSTSSYVTDDQIVGSLVMLNLSDLSIVQTLNFANRKMCASPAIYKDVIIVGFVQGGYGAYKITDTGFVELLNQNKTGTDTATELEFQSCAVDEVTNTLVFALYKYGVRTYAITYDEDMTFSLTIQSELKFADIENFNYNASRSHTVLSVCIKDGYAMLPLALIKSLIGSISTANDHRGVIVADLDDLTSYAVYELPFGARPNAPVGDGTDPQPTFIDVNDNHVIVNIGDKGIAVYSWNGNTLNYNGRFGNCVNQESEKVKFVNGKILSTYRQPDNTKNMWIKSWEIAEQLT